MASIELELRFKSEKLLHEMVKLCEDIRELTDMIPEWNAYEADPIIDNIQKRLSSWMEVAQVE